MTQNFNIVTDYTADVLRGWPLEGARERVEYAKTGSVLVNGDVVELQPDGTVDKVGATKSRRVGLVVVGNERSNSGNANGPLPAKAQLISAATWTGGTATVTTASAHGFVTGQTVGIGGMVSAGTGTFNGYFVVTVTGATTFTYAVAVDPGTASSMGTAQLQFVNGARAVQSTQGKVVVLWGNFIVRTANFAVGAYVPGSSITAANGKYQLASGSDPELGFVLSVQNPTPGQGLGAGLLTISVY